MAKVKTVGSAVAAVAMSFGLAACGVDSSLQPSDVPSQAALAAQGVDSGLKPSHVPSQTALAAQDEITLPWRSYTLTVSVVGVPRAHGSVLVVPPGSTITMRNTATLSFAEGTMVTLTAQPAGGRFGGWAGACTGSSATCTLSIKASMAVKAKFY